jgi:sugar-specific transcriptional regulator TrmB
MKAQIIMENLGYSKLEVKIYLGLLKIGGGSVSQIARYSHIPRSTIKDSVGEMHKKGLINFYPKKGHNFWVAESPKKLAGFLEEKHQNYKNILPVLQNLYSKRHPAEFVVKVYSDAEEILLILEDIIETKHKINALISWPEFVGILGAEAAWKFLEKLEARFLSIRLLVINSPETNFLKKQDCGLRHTKFLPKSIVLSGAAHFIYGNKTALIRLEEKTSGGVVIEDSILQSLMNTYFESLWNSGQ